MNTLDKVSNMTDTERFGKVFDSIAMGRSRWETWGDFIAVTACSIANAVKPMQSREELYLNTMRKYQPDEQQRLTKAAGLYFRIVDENPFQDLLGDLYMRLELGQSEAGQFFTPYNVCRMMAIMEVDSTLEKIERDGWISANDCACGGGATLIALADALYQRGCNYQKKCLFVGQDLLATTAMMCYIQLSMLGCAGYVKVGDSLADPITGDTLFAPEGENIWITPMYFSDVWHERRRACIMGRIIGRMTPVVMENHAEKSEWLPNEKPDPVTQKAQKHKAARKSKPEPKTAEPEPVIVLHGQQISMFEVGV